MQIKRLWKTSQSKSGQCPALYETDGGYVVQGKILDQETAAQLVEMAGDETAVFVPADVIDRIRQAR